MEEIVGTMNIANWWVWTVVLVEPVLDACFVTGSTTLRGFGVQI